MNTQQKLVMPALRNGVLTLVLLPFIYEWVAARNQPAKVPAQ
jgi:hypothetical protein